MRPLMLLVVVGCAPPPDKLGPPPIGPDASIGLDAVVAADATAGGTAASFAVEPPAIHVPAGRNQIFVADAPAVTWSVLEAGGGTIDAAGHYRAPEAPGTYHVVATSNGSTAIATVVVEQLQLTLFTGRLGGAGNVDGTGDQARFWTPRAITDDGAGTIFVTQNGAIRAIDVATRAVTTVAGNSAGLVDGVGDAAGFASPSTLAYAPATHTLYTADGLAIRAIDVPTRAVTTLVGTLGPGYADGPLASARFRRPAGLCISGTTLFVSDYGGGTIRSIDLASPTLDVATVAGTPDVHGYVDHADPALAVFHHPGDITCTPTTIYVAEPQNLAIRTIDRATGAVGTLLGGPGVTATNDGAFATAGIGQATYLSVDVANNVLYAVTSITAQIRALDLAGRTITTITPANLPFNRPAGIRVIGSKLWVADSWRSEVRTLDLATHVVTSIAGKDGTITHGTADGALAEATFTNPWPLAVAANGDLHVGGNGTIRTIALATGQVTWRAGQPGVLGFVDGAPGVAHLGTTYGLLADPHGRLWEAGSSEAIRQIGDDGTVTTRFGGLGQPGASDQPGTQARFDTPFNMVWVNDRIVVADFTNATIRSIDPASGMVTTIAGTAGVHESVDGVGAAARFAHPASLATDGVSKVWIGDWDSPAARGATIRELDLATMAVTTIVGDPHQKEVVDGIGSAARICGPWALAYDGAHSLYLADGGNGPGGRPVAMIRRVWLPTRAVSSYAGTPYRWGVQLGPLQTATLANPFSLVYTPDRLLVGGGEHAIVAIGR